LPPILNNLTTNSITPDQEKKKIFISRHLGPESPLRRLSADGHEIICESLINISQIRFTYTPKTKWIFFTSRNAIKYFFSQEPQVDDSVRYGVMGRSSAEFLATYGKTASFIGSGVDVPAIAKDFAGIIQNESVLLPQAIDSLKSIQKYLSFSNNSSNLFVYKTTLKTDFQIPECDILVFTSPSNVRAYFSKYPVKPFQRFVAIGSTTKAALQTHKVKHAALPAAFTEASLYEAVTSVLRDEQSQEFLAKKI
jgi:hydroxymethylbilane synthase